MSFYDLVKFSPASAPGTGAITIGPVVPGYFTPAVAGVPDGWTGTIVIRDGLNVEVCGATYTASTGVLTRGATQASTNSGAPINASATATIFFDVSAADLNAIVAGQVGGQVGFTAKSTMNASLNYVANTIAWVGGDPTPGNDGPYIKIGASGSGSWAAWTDPRLTASNSAIALANTVLGLFSGATSRNIYQTSTYFQNSSYNTNGTVANGSSTFCRILIPVTPLTQYWISCEAAPSGWRVYANWMQEYNSATPGTGSLVVNATPGTDGLTYPNNRRATITPRATTTYLGVNFNWPGGGTPTQADIDALKKYIMVNAGAALLDFDAPVATGDKVYPSTALNDTKDVLLVKSGTGVYVRHPLQGSTTLDTVRQMTVGSVAGAGVNGAIEFIGARSMARAAPDAATLALYASTTVSSLLQASGDEAPPALIRGMYMGGNHGVDTTFQLTKTAHGLTNVNVGEIGVDGAGKSWVLAKIVDANTIWVTAANTGTAINYSITGVLTGPTITFPTAGAFTYTASVPTFITPVLQNYTSEIRVDGVQIATDGFYRGNYVTIREKYSVPNPAAVLQRLIDTVGTGAPPAFNDPATTSMYEVEITYRFDEFGACVRTVAFTWLQAITLIGGTGPDYFGGMQWQVVNYTPDKVFAYVPDLTGPVTISSTNYALTARADITTAPIGEIFVPKTLCANPANPGSHSAFIVKTAAGVARFGHARGYGRRFGIGKPASRASEVTYITHISTARKQYSMAFDGGAVPSPAVGLYVEFTTWDAFYDMSKDGRRTIDVFYRDVDNKVIRVLDLHGTVSGEWFDVPPKLVGKSVSVVDANAGFILHSGELVHGDGMRITVDPAYGTSLGVSGGYGRAVLAIG